MNVVIRARHNEMPSKNGSPLRQMLILLTTVSPTPEKVTLTRQPSIDTFLSKYWEWRGRHRFESYVGDERDGIYWLTYTNCKGEGLETNCRFQGWVSRRVHQIWQILACTSHDAKVCSWQPDWLIVTKTEITELLVLLGTSLYW